MPGFAEEIKAYGRELGLDAVGVAPAEPCPLAGSRIKDQIRRGLRPPGWRALDVDAYVSPRSVLPDAESVVVAAECYLTSEPAAPAGPGGPRGTIARYAWRNYYKDVRTKLNRVAAFMKARLGPSLRFACFSNGPRLAEKPLAERAGVGWYGGHGVILTPGCGSWVVLGALVTNARLDVDAPSRMSCGSCRACVEACPTRAIVEPGVLDQTRCLQYLAHTPVDLPPGARAAWGLALYGCTACQDACPVNRKVAPRDRRPPYGEVGPSIPLMPILRMSEPEYRARYRGSQLAAGWVAFEAIQRNAAVALGNSGALEALAPLAQALRSHPSVLVRRHAAWALGRLGGPAALRALRAQARRANAPELARELKAALAAARAANAGARTARGRRTSAPACQ